jgi:hypothetical protein
VITTIVLGISKFMLSRLARLEGERT